MGNSFYHSKFTTTTRGLDRNSPPMRLYEKAKRLGIWNPVDIDLAQDKQDWRKLNKDEQDVILRLASVYQAGEEAVTLDLLPLIMVIATEGRLEEELFLTTFLWEEAKHTDFFQRYLDEVLEASGNDLSHYHTESYRAIFYEALPQALNRLKFDPSPEAQIIAAITYNMVVEGILAETGYHTYFTTLKRNNIMPGMIEGIHKIKQDESRHIAYGIYLISRLICEHGELWEIAESTMRDLFIPALSLINEAFQPYDPIPFGLDLNEFASFAIMQYQKRLARIQRAQGASFEEVTQIALHVINEEDA